MPFKTVPILVELTGVAGSATGSASVAVPPTKLQGVQVQYANQPGTTNVEVKCALDGVEKTLLLLNAHNDDVPLQGLGESIIDDVGVLVSVLVPPRLAGQVTVEVTNGDPDPEGVKVTLLVEL
jgi:hypothetical protein